MFSNIYYFSTLLKKSLSFNDFEKNEIFNFVKKGNVNLLKLIRILENDSKGFKYIKNNYNKGIIKITDELIENVKSKENKIQLNKIKSEKFKITKHYLKKLEQEIKK